jgi:hypothetical protein
MRCPRSPAFETLPWIRLAWPWAACPAAGSPDFLFRSPDPWRGEALNINPARDAKLCTALLFPRLTRACPPNAPLLHRLHWVTCPLLHHCHQHYFPVSALIYLAATAVESQSAQIDIQASVLVGYSNAGFALSRLPSVSDSSSKGASSNCFPRYDLLRTFRNGLSRLLGNPPWSAAWPVTFTFFTPVPCRIWH